MYCVDDSSKASDIYAIGKLCEKVLAGDFHDAAEIYSFLLGLYDGSSRLNRICILLDEMCHISPLMRPEAKDIWVRLLHIIDNEFEGENIPTDSFPAMVDIMETADKVFSDCDMVDTMETTNKVFSDVIMDVKIETPDKQSPDKVFGDGTNPISVEKVGVLTYQSNNQPKKIERTKHMYNL